jgi:hypothetical protein
MTPISNDRVEANGGGSRLASFLTRLRKASGLYGTDRFFIEPADCTVTAVLLYVDRLVDVRHLLGGLRTISCVPAHQKS